MGLDSAPLVPYHGPATAIRAGATPEAVSVNGSAKNAPYGPSQNILAVIGRLRDHGVPDPLTTSNLGQLSIPEGNIGRTLAGLSFLGLIGSDGRHTDTMRRLAEVPTDEYERALAEIIRGAYAGIFSILKPEMASDTQILDAFRGYQPAKQRLRMVMLFKGLCREAGLMPAERATGRATAVRSSNQRSGSQPVRRRAAPEVAPASPIVPAGNAPPPEDRRDPLPAFEEPWIARFRPVFDELPSSRKWTAAKRQRWVNALEAYLDLYVETIEVTDGSRPEVAPRTATVTEDEIPS